jgi:hypothetical protein
MREGKWAGGPAHGEKGEGGRREQARRVEREGASGTALDAGWRTAGSGPAMALVGDAV